MLNVTKYSPAFFPFIHSQGSIVVAIQIVFFPNASTNGTTVVSDADLNNIMTAYFTNNTALAAQYGLDTSSFSVQVQTTQGMYPGPGCTLIVTS